VRVCPACGLSVENKWIICPACGKQLRGPPGQKVAFKSPEIKSEIRPPDQRLESFDEITTVPVTDLLSEIVTTLSEKKKQLAMVFGVILIVCVALILYPTQTYVVRYSVALQSSEEVSVGHSYFDPYLEMEVGGYLLTVRDCAGVKYCNSELTFEFEYDRPFEAAYTVYVGGGEYIDDLTICISIEIESLTVDASCFLYHDSNDNLNLGVITTSHYINQGEIDKLK
jgi:hypothetical protein